MRSVVPVSTNNVIRRGGTWPPPQDAPRFLRRWAAICSLTFHPAASTLLDRKFKLGCPTPELSGKVPRGVPVLCRYSIFGCSGNPARLRTRASPEPGLPPGGPRQGVLHDLAAGHVQGGAPGEQAECAVRAVDTLLPSPYPRLQQGDRPGVASGVLPSRAWGPGRRRRSGPSKVKTLLCHQNIFT